MDYFKWSNHIQPLDLFHHTLTTVTARNVLLYSIDQWLLVSSNGYHCNTSIDVLAILLGMYSSSVKYNGTAILYRAIIYVHADADGRRYPPVNSSIANQRRDFIFNSTAAHKLRLN